jgi:hypothetical protein
LAFKEAALANLKAQPLVYLGNCVRSMYTLAAHLNTIQLAAFQELQRGERFEPYRLGRGHPHPFPHSGASRAFGLWTNGLTLLAWLGAAHALLRSEAALLPVAVVWLALWIGHTIVYMDFPYYGIKIPFVLAGAFYLVDRLPGALSFPWMGIRIRTAEATAFALGAAGLGITIWMLA